MTQDGRNVNIPGTGSTGYFGFEVNPRAGYVLSLGNRFQVTPLAGFSLEWWRRDLTGGLQIRNPDGSTATINAGGYVKSYTAFFLQGGVRAGYTVSRDLRLNAMLSLKVPLFISENVDETREGKGEHTLNSAISPRLGLELGASFHRFNSALTFDRWTLAQSPDRRVVQNGQTLVVHQPDSTRTLLGFKVGYAL